MGKNGVFKFFFNWKKDEKTGKNQTKVKKQNWGKKLV